MKFTHLSVVTLFCLALVGNEASQAAEDYWKSVWPNTPVPKALEDLLLPYGETDLPIKAEEEKQYWSVFFEHELHPGKKMSLGSRDKHSDEKRSQPFGLVAWREEESQPLETKVSRDEKRSQPFGYRVWREEESQPFGYRVWREEESQPFGMTVWQEEEESEPLEATRNQPFGLTVWQEEEESQPALKRKRIAGARKLGKEAGRAGGGGRRGDRRDTCGGSKAAVGEDKYCARSLESMVDFAVSKLGKDIHVRASSFAPRQDQYVVEEVRKVGESAVMCHRLNHRDVVFYCHVINATTTYMVPMVASDGTRARALAICHHDTRGMNPQTLYQVLKVKPGTVPVCHFVGNKALAWLPNSVSATDDDSAHHPCVI